MRRHWFFDFDGTLCDTERDIKDAWAGAIADLGLDCPDFEKLYSTGPTLADVLATLFPDRAGDAEFRRTFLDRFRSHYDTGGFPHSVPYPGIDRWLGELKKDGCALYVASNKRMAPLATLLGKLGWTDVFAGVYTPDAVAGETRTKARFLGDALRERGIDPSDAVMAGDMKTDVDAGRANGMFTIGCLWGYAKPGDLSEADELRERP